MSEAVRVVPEVLETIAAHAREALPAECCGVLLGCGSDVVDAVRGGNLADNPNRFVLDPKDHITARRVGRARGLEVIGFYHSHPHSEPEPSPTDVTNALYPGYLQLIIRPLAGGLNVRVFRQEGTGFVELAWVVSDRTR